MRRTLAALATATCAVTTACAQQAGENAEDYPRRGVTVVVPFAAGSTTDVAARLLAQCFERELQQPIVVENRAGGDGTVGSSAAARATPDGYTLVQLSTSSAVVAPHFTPDAGYTVNSFDLIGTFDSTPSIVVVHESSPITSLPQLVAADTTITMTSTGPQSAGGLVIDGLVRHHGLRANQVPMGSIGEARRALPRVTTEPRFYRCRRTCWPRRRPSSARSRSQPGNARRTCPTSRRWLSSAWRAASRSRRSSGRGPGRRGCPRASSNVSSPR